MSNLNTRKTKSRNPRIGSPVQTKADSEFTNPDPRQNDRINIHETKTITGRKSKNMIENLEYASKYVFQERSVTRSSS